MRCAGSGGDQVVPGEGRWAASLPELPASSTPRGRSKRGHASYAFSNPIVRWRPGSSAAGLAGACSLAAAPDQLARREGRCSGEKGGWIPCMLRLLSRGTSDLYGVRRQSASPLAVDEAERGVAQQPGEHHRPFQGCDHHQREGVAVDSGPDLAAGDALGDSGADEAAPLVICDRSVLMWHLQGGLSRPTRQAQSARCRALSAIVVHPGHARQRRGRSLGGRPASPDGGSWLAAGAQQAAAAHSVTYCRPSCGWRPGAAGQRRNPTARQPRPAAACE